MAGSVGTLERLREYNEHSFANDFDDEDDYDDEEDSEALTNGSRPEKKKQKGKKKRTSRAKRNSIADVKEQIIYDYDIKNYAVEKPMRELRFMLPFMAQPIVINPFTTLIGMIPLWIATILCMVSCL